MRSISKSRSTKGHEIKFSNILPSFVLYKSILHCTVHRVTASILYILFSPSAASLPFRYTSHNMYKYVLKQ